MSGGATRRCDRALRDEGRTCQRKFPAKRAHRPERQRGVRRFPIPRWIFEIKEAAIDNIAPTVDKRNVVNGRFVHLSVSEQRLLRIA
jgi:hypothetical protein